MSGRRAYFARIARLPRSRCAVMVLQYFAYSTYSATPTSAASPSATGTFCACQWRTPPSVRTHSTSALPALHQAAVATPSMLTRLSSYLTLLGALAVTASPVVQDTPVVSIEVVRKLNLTSGATLVDIDRARSQSFKTGGQSRKRNAARGVFNTPVTNTAVSYIASVGASNHFMSS